MKKILSLLFVLLLFASCEKEVEKPKEDTPEVNEVEIAQPIKPELVEPEIIEPETIPEQEVIEPEVPLPEEIVLPEADENTITITIDFPEDFPETPYTEPELVSPEEFEWGEYLPLVEYDLLPNNVFEIKPANTLLGKTVTDLYDKSVWVKVKNKYYETIGPDETFFAKRTNGKTLFYEKVINFDALTFFKEFSPDGNNIWWAYASDNSAPLYKIVLKKREGVAVEGEMYITEFLDNRYFVLYVYSGRSEFRGVNAYLYDIEKEELRLLKPCAFSPSLSPDKKYLVYTAPHGDQWDMSSAKNNLDAMGYGFYIEDLTTHKTVYYETKTTYNIVLDWVKAETK